MKNKLQAEAYVLDRVMYMLDEYSVRYLTEEDEMFGDYVNKLYAQVHAKSRQLRRQAV